MLKSRGIAQADLSAFALPEAVDGPIDRAHLFRMTLGDHELEGEVLRLFDQQVGLILARLDQADPGGLRALVHTLDGSARGVGAWRVARASREVELAIYNRSDTGPAVERLRTACAEASAAIADLERVRPA